jgi:hypothetical protein
MSEYVEARYALITLEEARESPEDRATALLNGLLEDLDSPRRPSSARADTLASIRHLALILCNRRAPPSSYWEAARTAAHAWRDGAFH